VSFCATLAEDLFRSNRLTGWALDDERPTPVRRAHDLELFLDKLASVQPRRSGPVKGGAAVGKQNVMTFVPDGVRGSRPTLMDKKRPQLSLEELQQLRWLLGGGLTLLAVWTVLYMELEARALMVVASLAVGACTFWPRLPARLPGLFHVLAFPAIVLFFVGDLWITTEVLPAMVRLDILLLLYRGVTYRQRRDDLQIVVLGLFLIVVAGVLTVSLVFALQLLAYAACALAYLLAITLIGAAEEGRPESGKIKHLAPGWAERADWPSLLRRLRAVADWRVVTVGVVLLAGVVAVSALLFVSIPRFQIESSLFLERYAARKVRTGFSDSIKLGDVIEIQQDSGVALSVDVSDHSQVPASPYWRMLVLDEYESGSFRVSAATRRNAFGRERTDSTITSEGRLKGGAEVQWTFYLESGTSRYLPLLGGFEQLRFREPQSFRFAPAINVLALRDEPLSMTAYRVQGFAIGSGLPDPGFSLPAALYPPQIALQLNPEQRSALARIGSEILGADSMERLPAAEFARRAGQWLRQNHGYSLTPTLPSGGGDPLVRWLVSREAGHCELFAGALVLIMRAQNVPARVAVGFRGGTWNAYSNNFTVRNSDAHAWAEVYDGAAGQWARIDPLEVAGAEQAAGPKGEAALAARTDRSWSARLDSLRIFWYRRIVNFDQRSQLETLKEVKESAQGSGRQLRDLFGGAMARVRRWLGGAWPATRVAGVLALIAFAAFAGWAWRNHRYFFLRLAGGIRRYDPVRSEAGRWLRRLQVPMASGVPGDTEVRRATAELQRLRFGATATWPEPDAVFRRARRAARRLARAR
jgi:hypothetical protein